MSLAYSAVGRPRLLFVHANGFCKETWEPVQHHLPPHHVSVDQRGHGDSSTPQLPFDWWDLGRDVLAVVDQVSGGSLTGVGHSSGGTALIMAELERPGTFARLVLVEPIVPPPPFVRLEDHPLAVLAEKRRPLFGSPEEAERAYRGRGPFAGWTPAALGSYVQHGFHEVDGGWELKCRPAVEAEFYRAAHSHGVWDRLAEVGCAVDLVVGEASDTHPPSVAAELGRRFQQARLHSIEGATHFAPMERPRELASIIAGQSGPESPVPSAGPC